MSEGARVQCAFIHDVIRKNVFRGVRVLMLRSAFPYPKESLVKQTVKQQPRIQRRKKEKKETKSASHNRCQSSFPTQSGTNPLSPALKNKMNHAHINQPQSPSTCHYLTVSLTSPSKFHALLPSLTTRTSRAQPLRLSKVLSLIHI